MINSVSNVNLYQPKKVTIETKPFTSVDEGMPYQGTEVVVTEEKPGGEQKVLAQHALTATSEKELENIKEILSKAYAQETCKFSQASEPSTPIPGKDFYA